MSDRLAVLQETLFALAQAKTRLLATHRGVAKFLPLTKEKLAILKETERERFDAYAIRYARCQDLLYPTMRALARAQLEPKAERSFLELFALMQKQSIVEEIDDWERQRSLRNAVSHEYPDTTVIVDILNGISEAVPEILRYVKALESKAEALKDDSIISAGSP
jgi:uncharacterized protein YutE (UPF0331/DUF86 family)